MEQAERVKKPVLSLRKPVVEPVKALSAKKKRGQDISERNSMICRQREEIAAKEVAIAAYKRRYLLLLDTIAQLMGLGPDDFRKKASAGAVTRSGAVPEDAGQA